MAFGRKKIAKAFNEWQRRYIADPGAFEKEFQTVGVFLAERQAGREPSYGENCAAYLEKLMAEV